MDERRSRPHEQPPRRRGGRLAWLLGTVPGIVLLGFVVVVAVVLAAVALGA